MIFHKNLARSQCMSTQLPHVHVSKERFITLFDNGKYLTIDYESPAQDPLNFKDTKNILTE